MSIKKFIAAVFIFLSGVITLMQSAAAGMTEEQMQQMMESAQKMQECMARIDQSAMDKLSVQSEKMQAEIEALCTAGKRDAAEDKAMKYGKEIAGSKVMQQMKKCGEMGQQMMQQMPMMPGAEGNASGMGHVCDGF